MGKIKKVKIRNMNRSFRNMLLITVLLLTVKIGQAQSNMINSNYPNVTLDRAATKSYTTDLKLRFTIPGVLGMGLSASYFKPNLFHVYGETGVGWTFKTEEADAERDWVSLWGKLKVGYPLHIVSHGKAKWYTGISNTRVKYYTVEVPVHNYLIPEVGLHYNPVPYRIISDEVAGVDKHYYNFQATVITAGISWRTIVDSRIRVKDSDDGGIYSGKLVRMSDIQAGLLFGTKDKIKMPLGASAIDKSDGIGYYIYISFPYRTANIDIGYNSLGYNDKDNREKAAQIYFGWSIHL